MENNTDRELLDGLIGLFDFKRHYHRGTSGLKTAPMRALERAAAEGEIQTLDLGKACDIPPATLIGILDDLEGRGLIRRLRSSTDRRVVLVSATEAGRKLVARRGEEERSFAAKVERGLQAAERRELERLLAKMLAGLGDRSDLFKE